MRSDLLSKRLYYIGCLGLPWLWIVHVLYYWKTPSTNTTTSINNTSSTTSDRDNSSNTSANDNNIVGVEGFINPDDHFTDEPTSMTPDEIQMEAIKWMNRCKYSAMVVVALWISWIVIVQVLRDQLPANLFILSPDSPQLTGW